MLRWPERFDGALIMAGMKVRADGATAFS